MIKYIRAKISTTPIRPPPGRKSTTLNNADVVKHLFSKGHSQSCVTLLTAMLTEYGRDFIVFIGNRNRLRALLDDIHTIK